jgi:hypothetical protein
MQEGQAAALSQAQAISDLGGIGKTQVAVEYASFGYSSFEEVERFQAEEMLDKFKYLVYNRKDS